MGITCGRLTGLWLAQTVVTLIATLILSQPDGQHLAMTEQAQVGLWFTLGISLGWLVAALQRHPRRILGLIPFGATGLFIGLLVVALGVPLSHGLCVFLGAMWEWTSLPFPAGFQVGGPPSAPGVSFANRCLFNYAGLAILMSGFVVYGLASGATGLEPWITWSLVAVAGLAAAAAWWFLFREQMELLLEILLLLFYRIRTRGPGLDEIPPWGPVLVVANHSAWLDPMWLAKVLPRRMIPMMTSVFYDLPVMRWLMVHVAHAIRVQASTYRREAPELDVAIAALDRGECVVIFPEGMMRRRESAPLRQFGQGVWHILSERPATPVVVCWIEGGWGSYFSYFNGKPTRNKQMDFRRPIDVAVGPCRTLSPELLKDQRKTRAFLMEQCLQARRYLDLPPLPLNNGSAEETSGKVTAEDLT